MKKILSGLLFIMLISLGVVFGGAVCSEAPSISGWHCSPQADTSTKIYMFSGGGKLFIDGGCFDSTSEVFVRYHTPSGNTAYSTRSIDAGTRTANHLEVYLTADDTDSGPGLPAGCFGWDIEFYVHNPNGDSVVKSIRVVNILPSSFTITSSADTLNCNEEVTFTGTVTENDGHGMPTGVVEFFDCFSDMSCSSKVSLGTASVDASGKASITTSFSSAGTHYIAAQYRPDSASCCTYKDKWEESKLDPQVNCEPIPEFSAIAAGIALVGAGAGFIFLRRKK